MNDKSEMAKLGLAFAVGVSLSAGYVVLGIQMRTPDVVVVQERCPDAEEQLGDGDREAPLPEGLELAALRGEGPVPEGFSLRLGLDGLWTGDGRMLAKLEDGRFAQADVEQHMIRALEPTARDRARFSSTAVLWIDHRVVGATLIDLLFTLERGGFREFALVVAGADAPEAFRFESKVYGGFIDTPDPWTSALSLRLEEQGLSAWLVPRGEGRPRTDAPAPLALACGMPIAATTSNPLGAIEDELCDLRSGPLAVEFVIAPERSVGELLTVRAAESRPDACRGPSNLVAPEASPVECADPLTTADALARFNEAAGQDPTAAVKASVQGSLDKEVVRKVVARRIGEIRECYNEGLTKDPELAGTVVVEFVIGETGKVVETALGDRTDLPDRKTARCIANAISRWKFPTPEGGEVRVTYPFILSPG